MKQSLFRSIRMKLLNEGKLLRYLTYAIGEVLLIIVGILLSLKIYDWNEDRKAQVEFDAYVVQLNEDVKTAIEFIERRAGNGENQANNAMTVLKVVEGTEEPENLEAFEKALGNLGKFSAGDIPYGNLRVLLDGNLDAVARDEHLSGKVYELVTFIDHRQQIIVQEVKLLDLSQAIFAKFRGLTREGPWPGGQKLPVRYDLDKMRASEDFIYAIHNAMHALVAAHQNYDLIAEEFEKFLTVLEEYE